MNRTGVVSAGWRLVFALLWMNLVSLPLAAQSGWATVDTRVLMMFHPQMSGFDYANGLFFRESARDRNFDKTIAELKSAREKADKELVPIRAERQKLAGEKFALQQQLARAKSGLAAGDLEKLQREKSMMEAALQELERQKPANRDAERLFAARKVDLRERIAIVEARITGRGAGGEASDELLKKLEKVDKRVMEIDALALKIEEKAISAVYLTSEETNKRLQVITDEIQELIKRAAKEMKVEIVMDTSFAMRAQTRKDRMKMIPAVDESPDVVSSSLFHSFDNLTINPELQAALSGPEGTPLEPEHLIVGKSLGMQSNLTQYLEFRNYMPEKVAGFSGGRLFLSGGTDLTAWVARQLFDRYRIPDTVKNSFMVTLRNYLNFEKEPAIRERDY
jgi:hypothetical protein